MKTSNLRLDCVDLSLFIGSVCLIHNILCVFTLEEHGIKRKERRNILWERMMNVVWSRYNAMLKLNFGCD